MQFTSFTNWNQLPKSANKLFTQAEQKSVFFSLTWYENLVETALTEGQSILLACIVDNDEILAILPLLKDENDDYSSLCHLYSSLYSPLLAEGNQAEILACLVEGLSQLTSRPLSFKPFDQHDKNMDALQQAMEAAGYSCHRKFAFYNWIYRVEQGESFEEYLAKRPSKLRNTIARKQRKLDREHDYEIRMFIDDGAEQALEDYNKAYQASWKAHEQFGEILSGLVKRFSKLGWLRLAILYIDQQPAAAQFWFVVGKKASIFRLAYDEAWKQYSPGSILTKYLMEYVIDTDKVEEIDFLTGNEQYKQDWMSERRERWSMVCAKPYQPKAKNGLFGSLKHLLKSQ